jgi:uncharacterized protein (DUF433 family)
MTTQVELQPTAPPLHLDEAGGIRIGQSRVTLDSLLAAYHSGATPEEIAVQYPVLELAEIYAALAYYLSNQQQVDTYLERRHQLAQQRREQLIQEHNLGDLRQRLLVRQQSQLGD